uniref:thioredoxin-dependent peroxiredoxin n=1 Tax=Elaeophora elaphi TaxID=1147741 RepID=A0A0R3RXD2_9BILA
MPAKPKQYYWHLLATKSSRRIGDKSVIDDYYGSGVRFTLLSASVSLQIFLKEMTLAGSKAFIGQPAPNFKTTAVVNGDFKEISLCQFKGKYVVLFFYPLDFTFVCPTEIIAFSDRIAEFKKLDTYHSSVAAVCSSFVVCNLVEIDGLFIIDPEGILRQITVNDLPVGRSVDETLRLVQAFQFVDKHGEVCPANWQPGSDTIKPEVKGSKAYFEKQ